MQFNYHQIRLWNKMLKSINDYQKGEICYSELVYGLEGSLDAGEFKDEKIIRKWYKFWGPLEIAYATKGEDISFDDVEKYILDMKSYLKEVLDEEKGC